MYIKTAVDLGRLDVYAQGRELSTIMGMDMKDGKRINHPMEELVHVHTFTDPVLVTDSHRIGQLPPVLRDTLFALFGSQTRTVEYDGVSVTCDSRHTGVWSPSIDTLLFARVLNRLRLQPKVAIEIGCGSGS